MRTGETTTHPDLTAALERPNLRISVPRELLPERADFAIGLVDPSFEQCSLQVIVDFELPPRYSGGPSSRWRSSDYPSDITDDPPESGRADTSDPFTLQPQPV